MSNTNLSEPILVNINSRIDRRAPAVFDSSMEVLTDDQGPIGLEHEPSHPDDNPTYDEDDEFDFNIGGEDDLDPNAESYNANSSFVNVADQNKLEDKTSFNYDEKEQENPADVEIAPEGGDPYNGDGNEEMLELNVDAIEATGNANEVDESGDIDQVGTPSGIEAVVQAHTEEGTEDVVEEEVYYRETGEKFEDLSNVTRPQPDHGHDDMERATSVDNVPGDNELHTADIEVRVPEDQVSDSKSPIVETAKIEAVEVLAEDDAAAFGLEADEPAEGEVRGKQAQYVGGGPSYDDDDQERLSSHKDEVADPADEAQDQESWDREDHDDEDTDTRPKVTISYQSQEYSLFAESPDQDPDHYFLADLDSLHQPLSQLLANIRDVISDEIAPSQEVSLRVNGLGFEFAESTTKDFLDETTLAHIIEVNKQLIANEGGSPSPILHCYLGLRPSCLHRFSELSKAADEGKGLSDIAMFYDDASMDDSVKDHEEHDFSQDIISDSPSLEEVAVDNGDMTEKNGGSPDMEQYYNPFRTTDEQFQTIGNVTMSNAGDGEFAEREDLSVEALGVGSTEFEDANIFESISGDIGDEFKTNAAEAPDYARDSSRQSEGAYDEPTAEDVEVADVEQQTGLQTDLAKEDYGNINETVVDPADDNNDNDDDYLDLGNDEGNDSTYAPAIDSAFKLDDEVNGSLAPQGISPQTSQHSSATATLDGNDNDAEDVAPVNPDPADSRDPQNEAESDGSNGEVDEIDWNHDEEGELDDANQNPTTLSPSSPSAKRNREEDENADGTGDENAIKRRRTEVA